ncbi:FHA domain-containing protein [Caldichromatium japonicum]|uniref:FHA domain-containing protein n=1 Tax=Caldichromatium japonicum TaxID=2699430 RepID=A0A6G7VDJ0_9GAMM|nr:FHA domain-containing protein [Caldichromatium japonicum]QIK37857.1 FHA domain-containing protein [Caldichromatium japonicum]
MEIMVCVIHRAGAVRPRALPFVVNETGIEIGRALSCDLCLEDTERVISHRHARIYEAEGRLWVTDLGRNGTLLNDRPLPLGQPVALKDRDVLTIGAYDIWIGLDSGLEGIDPPQPAVGPEATALVTSAQRVVCADQTQVLTESQTAVMGEVTQRLEGTGCTQPGPKTIPAEDKTVCLDWPTDPPLSGDPTAVLAQRTQVLSPPPPSAKGSTQIMAQPSEPGCSQALVPGKFVSDALIDAVIAELSTRLDPVRWEQRLVGHAGPDLSEEGQARCWQGFKAAYPGILLEIRAALVGQRGRR